MEKRFIGKVFYRATRMGEEETEVPYDSLSVEANVQAGFDLLDNAILDTLYECVTHTHRTLQQSFWRVIFRLVAMYAEAPSDGRNEAAVQACKKLRDFMQEEKQYLPFI